MAITLTSPAFSPGEPIPKQFTGEGVDVSVPLQWSGLPKDTHELALICDDPDAPRPQPWVHWVIYKIPSNTAALPAGIEKSRNPVQVPGAVQGQNTWGKVGYGGPMPPPGHGVHRYFFKLYALGTPLDLPPGAPPLDKDGLLKAIADHILDQAELIGTYQR